MDQPSSALLVGMPKRRQVLRRAGVGLPPAGSRLSRHAVWQEVRRLPPGAGFRRQ